MIVMSPERTSLPPAALADQLRPVLPRLPREPRREAPSRGGTGRLAAPEARVRPHLRLSPASPQLPALLRRPADLGRRHLDAEHRARLGRGPARTALARAGARDSLALPLRAVHAARPVRRRRHRP